MGNIIAPLIVFIIAAAIYAIFELIIRRKERLMIIEKIGDKLTPDSLGVKGMNLSFMSDKGHGFGALKAAGLLMGIGLGLLGGFFIHYNYLGINNDYWQLRELIVGSSALFGGGLGLLVAFMMELQLLKKKE